MKTRILTIAILISGMMMFSNSLYAGKKAVKFASSLENEMDPVMTIEAWMVSDLSWNPALMQLMVTDEEGRLQVESWMTEPAVWNRPATAGEADLKIEAWMLSSLVWERPWHAMENETGLILEGWMYNQAVWNRQSPVS